MESHSHVAAGKVSFRTTTSIVARPRSAMDLWDSRTPFENPSEKARIELIRKKLDANGIERT
jgi:hypothetical protein